ncbi:hypothetical protein SODALDRAFT_379096 [Sodiomyces alkalinus F11]|uniref:Uncharacterized protein n=1 Tax=Sodiomyces alkalinus (strain CBS 110278 / VKM F-3762 / F11) TaxID=1314773 RepID=A0A3N2PU31_SODAK|nr:hypothetical protein SODALDRAFT_379096 [Sodiomyces alkalinus F11]ROT37836.1 hypothetical protein SODALDRAFT_379096 [Sodiomyces alkalinus F11]
MGEKRRKKEKKKKRKKEKKKKGKKGRLVGSLGTPMQPNASLTLSALVHGPVECGCHKTW